MSSPFGYVSYVYWKMGAYQNVTPDVETTEQLFNIKPNY